MTEINEKQLLRSALILSIITIVYNLAEGLVSTFFGYTDETIALSGFGFDSFVEVISGIGIAHMVWRMKKHNISERDSFEKTALRITGSAFYVLTLGLIAGSVLKITYKSQPDTTIPGIIIAVISIATMWFLYRYKLKVGKELKSDPIIADANCTKTCFYLSFVLLASSALYHFFKMSYIDIIGGLGIAWFAFKEGRESFAKAKSKNLGCCCGGGSCCDK